MKDHKSAAALDAIANMTKNSQFFRVKDLSDHAVYQIQRADEKLTLCGSCRYQTGCLRCDAAKALSYHIRNEAQKANKVPKWEGPGLKGMVRFSACFFSEFLVLGGMLLVVVVVVVVVVLLLLAQVEASGEEKEED